MIQKKTKKKLTPYIKEMKMKPELKTRVFFAAAQFIGLILLCSSLQAVVSDTQSYFEIASDTIIADNINSAAISIFIRDDKGNPLKDKQPVIITSRISSDSIIQPILTDISGKTVGSISSSDGGWDTISIVCDGKTIGCPHKWESDSQEDFMQAETMQNIDTSTFNGSIKILHLFLNSDIPNNDFEDGFNTWTVIESPEYEGFIATFDIFSTMKYHGAKSAKMHFEEDKKIRTLFMPNAQLLDSENNCLDYFSFSPTTDWQEIIISTSNRKEQNIKLQFQVTLCNDTGVQLITKVRSDLFKCSGENISIWYKKEQISATNIKWLLIDFIKGGCWQEIAPNTATYVSKPYDCGYDIPFYSEFGAQYQTSGQTITFDIRTADSTEALALENWQTANTGSINCARKRWVQWRTQMQTNNVETSPILNSISIDYRTPKKIYFVPALKITGQTSDPQKFSPNNDNIKDTTLISYTLIDKYSPDTVCLRIYNPGRRNLVRTVLNYIQQNTGSHQVIWDGTTDTGAIVSDDGDYICEITMSNCVADSATAVFLIGVDLVKPSSVITKAMLGDKQVGFEFGSNEEIAFWDVLRSIGDTQNFQVIFSGNSVPGFTDTGPLGDNQSYYYKIIANDIAGNTFASNTFFSRTTPQGAVIPNNGNFAQKNIIIRSKDNENSFIAIQDTATFGDTIEFVRIEVAKKDKQSLEAENKPLPADKKFLSCFEITAYSLDPGFNPVSQVSNWSAAKPVFLKFGYADLPDNKLSTLSVYQWFSNRWNKLGGDLDIANRTISLSLNHFSVFALMYNTVPDFKGAKPNPFTPNNDGINDYVEIRFDNPSNDEVKLSIFDMPGHLEWNKEYAAGTNSVRWDGKNFSGRIVESGAYIYQVEVGARVVNGIVAIAK